MRGKREPRYEARIYRQHTYGVWSVEKNRWTCLVELTYAAAVEWRNKLNKVATVQRR